MIQFEWYWIFFCLPIPWLLRLSLPKADSIAEAALRVPQIKDFSVAGTVSAKTELLSWPLWLATFAWISLVIAVARPQWVGKVIELPVSGRDLMLAVDLSGSMQREDFVVGDTAVDRLTATKKVASEFIERRVGDRLGLILFGKQAYLQTPLTFDRKTVKTLLDEAVIGLAGKETAIGDAIGLGVKRLRQSKQQRSTKDAGEQILILLTDGANTAGEVSPLQAAELAATEGLKVYTIGIGADEMLVRSFFGTRKVNPSVDLDENTLKAIANKTGGRYFRARDTGELQKIYTLLDKLEPIVQDAQSFRPKISLFYWPLTLAILLGALVVVARIQGR